MDAVTDASGYWKIVKEENIFVCVSKVKSIFENWKGNARESDADTFIRSWLKQFVTRILCRKGFKVMKNSSKPVDKDEKDAAPLVLNEVRTKGSRFSVSKSASFGLYDVGLVTFHKQIRKLQAEIYDLLSRCSC